MMRIFTMNLRCQPLLGPGLYNPIHRNRSANVKWAKSCASNYYASEVGPHFFYQTTVPIVSNTYDCNGYLYL
jgi:hypothetical protein